MAYPLNVIVWCCLTISTYLVASLNALPASYCLYPLNKTNCGGAPTPVFSYYKSGSRCEIEIWRGCPSYNRFDNEATCSHYCIGRIKFEKDEVSGENEIDDYDEDPCEGELNTRDCGRPSINVYTYDSHSKTCHKSKWMGCKTKNMFRNKDKCTKMCLKFGDIDKWSRKIEQLTPPQLDQLNTMLDEYLTQNGRDAGGDTPREIPINQEFKAKGGDAPGDDADQEASSNAGPTEETPEGETSVDTGTTEATEDAATTEATA